MIDPQTIDNLAHLARLHLEADEKQQLATDLASILTWMSALNEVDTEGVVPLIHITETHNVLRADVVEEPLDHERALRNAPSRDSSFFRVPRVIE
jgi:aspartyl-tRNA(Asn)/glutamyl-tRNA(Gln) amidotransferase subunit C